MAKLSEGTPAGYQQKTGVRPHSFTFSSPRHYTLNRELAIQGKLRQQRNRALATAAEVSPNADRPIERDVNQRTPIEAVCRKRVMGCTLRTVIRPVTIRIGKLFRIALDRASKAVYNAVCIVMQCGQPNNR